MMTNEKMSDRSAVRVDEESFLARVADWHSHVRGRPVAGMGRATGEAFFFVADELLLDGEEQELAEEFVARYGADLSLRPLCQTCRPSCKGSRL